MNRNFEGIWITKEIWLCKELTLQEKCLLVEIRSLDNEDTHCYASNEYLMDFLNCSYPTLKRCLKKLEDNKLIERGYNDNGIRIIKCKINNLILLSCEPPGGLKNEPPPGSIMSPPPPPNLGVQENIVLDNRKIELYKYNSMEKEESFSQKILDSLKNGKEEDPEITLKAKEITKFFVESILSWAKTLPFSKSKVWHKHIEWMMRHDGISEEEIRELIKWLEFGKDSESIYWRSHIFCTQRLREKYVMLKEKMKLGLSGKTSFSPKTNVNPALCDSRKEEFLSNIKIAYRGD